MHLFHKKNFPNNANPPTAGCQKGAEEDAGEDAEEDAGERDGEGVGFSRKDTSFGDKSISLSAERAFPPGNRSQLGIKCPRGRVPPRKIPLLGTKVSPSAPGGHFLPKTVAIRG